MSSQTTTTTELYHCTTAPVNTHILKLYHEVHNTPEKVNLEALLSDRTTAVAFVTDHYNRLIVEAARAQMPVGTPVMWTFTDDFAPHTATGTVCGKPSMVTALGCVEIPVNNNGTITRVPHSRLAIIP